MDARLRMRFILWAALLASSVMHLVLALIIPAPDTAADSVMYFALCGAALTSAVASFLLPRMLERKVLDGLNATVEDVPDPSAEAMFRDNVPTMKVVRNGEDIMRDYLSRTFGFYVIQLAFRESIAIFGLTLHFLGYERGLLIPFFAVGIGLIAMSAPSKGRLVGNVEGSLNATLQLGT